LDIVSFKHVIDTNSIDPTLHVHYTEVK